MAIQRKVASPQRLREAVSTNSRYSTLRAEERWFEYVMINQQANILHYYGHLWEYRPDLGGQIAMNHPTRSGDREPNQELGQERVNGPSHSQTLLHQC